MSIAVKQTAEKRVIEYLRTIVGPDETITDAVGVLLASHATLFALKQSLDKHGLEGICRAYFKRGTDAGNRAGWDVGYEMGYKEGEADTRAEMALDKEEGIEVKVETKVTIH